MIFNDFYLHYLHIQSWLCQVPQFSAWICLFDLELPSSLADEVHLLRIQQLDLWLQHKCHGKHRTFDQMLYHIQFWFFGTDSDKTEKFQKYVLEFEGKLRNRWSFFGWAVKSPRYANEDWLRSKKENRPLGTHFLLRG